jgi:hypothetical protein
MKLIQIGDRYINPDHIVQVIFETTVQKEQAIYGDLKASARTIKRCVVHFTSGPPIDINDDQKIAYWSDYCRNAATQE